MGGAENQSPPCSPPSESSSGGRNAATPASWLLFFHKAFRRELMELRRVVMEEAGGACDSRELNLVELKARVEFFRNVYKHHCAAEAQVLFLALDARVGNITCTYYLQHYSTDSMFESVLSCLDRLGWATHDLQELVTNIGTLRDSICQHMVKEEKQVFPLLKSYFSSEEQASLVWQFMCSFPVMLLKDIFPWLASLLPTEERLDLKDCICNILAQDKSALLETVIFWINKADTKSQENCHKDDRISECSQDQDNLRDVSTLCLLKNGPFECLLRWQAAIKSDLEEILNKLDQARVQEFPSLSSVIVKIKFLNEVLIFHSDILENILYPLVEESSLHQTSPLYTSVPLKNEVVGLQNVLYDANKIHEPTFLESLCSQMESLVLLTTEHLSFQEREIFPLISEKCEHKSQLELVIKSLHTLPLGLLKCVVTWFSSHLPKDELKFILHGIGQSCLLDKPFALLLHEWVYAGYSGKSSTENLEEIFSRRVPFMSELIRDDNDPGKNIKQENLSSACCSRTPYLQSVSGSSGPPTEAVSCNILEPRPMDHIYYFHKAIKKDLESLVLDAAKLSKDSKLLLEFTQHFCSVRCLYELHSETEDKIAFPALEANLNARNITQSYSIDHEMEAQYFERVSGIIDKMSGVNVTVSWAEYRQLCLELEDSCKSLKKILEDHILREETELWPLFREYFSIEEQETILGYMLGITRAEILQKMIVWLMAHLSLDEQQAMMNYWRRATYVTKFNEWLGEWWENADKYDFGEAEKTIRIPTATNSVNVVSEYLSKEDSRDLRQDINAVLRNNDYNAAKRAKKTEGPNVFNHRLESFKYVDVQGNQLSKPALEVHQLDKNLVASQLDQEAKLHFDSDDVITTNSGKLYGQFPSYRDSEGSVFGCKHYKQNCKLVASCCNRIFTCWRCHDEEIYHDDDIYDHVMDRNSITQMMCMRCLEIQPIGPACLTPSCSEYSMARYYCKICKVFDDERYNLRSLISLIAIIYNDVVFWFLIAIILVK